MQEKIKEIRVRYIVKDGRLVEEPIIEAEPSEEEEEGVK